MALANQSEPNRFSFSHLASFSLIERGFVWSSGGFGFLPCPLSYGGRVIVLSHGSLKFFVAHVRAIEVTSLNRSGVHPCEAQARPVDEPEAFSEQAHKGPQALARMVSYSSPANLR